MYGGYADLSILAVLGSARSDLDFLVYFIDVPFHPPLHGYTVLVGMVITECILNTWAGRTASVLRRCASGLAQQTRPHYFGWGGEL